MFEQNNITNKPMIYRWHRKDLDSVPHHILKYGAYNFPNNIEGFDGYYIIGTNIFIEGKAYIVYHDIKIKSAYDIFYCLGKAIKASNLPTEKFLNIALYLGY